MARKPDIDTERAREAKDTAQQAGKSIYRTAADVVLTGIVVIIPLVITLYILKAALDFIAGALRPFIQVLEAAGLIESVQNWGLVELLVAVGIYSNVVEFLTTVTAVFILAVVIVGVGLLARVRYGEQLIEYFDRVIGAIPGVGSLYGSFRRMADAMLESSVENFQEVVLVEFPYDDVYVMGFKTSDAAGPLAVATGERDLTTLFLPLAPNPIMGGFLAHVPDERIMSVDMTVDEAVRTIITSGIATESPDSDAFRDLDDEEVDGVREITEHPDPSEDGDGKSNAGNT
jgi:uncharacterized membrane protein